VADKTDKDAVETTSDESLSKSDGVVEDAVTEDAKIEDAEVVEDVLDDATSEDDKDPVVEEEPAPAEIEAEAEVEQTPPPAPAPEPQVIVEKAGFLPLLLGGVAAGAIGFGVAYQWFGGSDDATATALQNQQRTIQSLNDQIEELKSQVALAPTATDVETGFADVGARVSGLDENVSALGGRLEALERLPAASGEGASTSMLALESEMQALRDLVQDQKTDLQEAAQDAAAIEQAARDAARLETARAAMGRLQIAAATGVPFADALADLTANTDAEIPADLSDLAAEGIPELETLQNTFPDAARSALSIVRSEKADENVVGNRLTNFLKAQTGARSVTPREGNDADAVLSRVEAAVKSGNLTDALAEIEALPEVGRAALSDWTGSASQRLGALNALDALTAALASN